MTKNTLNQALRNAPLIALTVTVSLALEAFGWGYIFLTNHGRSEVLGVSVPLALVEAIIISATGLMALIAAFVAAERRSDPRPEQRSRALGAQVLAVALIIPPVLKAADSFALPAQADAAAAYRSSDQYQTELENSRRHDLDSAVVALATANLARGIAPRRAVLDFTWFVSLLGASFLYGVNMMAASCLWRAKPETPAERDRRLESAERARRRADRRRKHDLEMAKLAVEAARNRPSFIKAIFSGTRKSA